VSCSAYRTALSSRLDGEPLPEGIDERSLEEHLAQCPRCREWERRAKRLREETREQAEGDHIPQAPDPDVVRRILKALKSDEPEQ
jgi:predicted anti-sigma-YlaC factor YlaD